MKYKAFISYRHLDYSRKQAEALERALKRYAKPLLRAPIKIFRDEKNMVPGEGLSKLIRNGLNQAEYLLFLAEEEAAQSVWCKDELEYWCRDLGRADKIIIVHIGDKIVVDQKNDKIDWKNSNALPSVLKPFIQSIPLYLDLSWIEKEEDATLKNKQYKIAINSIIAKFRGVTPAEISDEEIRTHRRNKRLKNIAILITILFIILIALVTRVAMEQRDLARHSLELEKQAKGAMEQSMIESFNNRIKVLQKDSLDKSRLIELATNAERIKDVKIYQVEIDSIIQEIIVLKEQIQKVRNRMN